MSFFTEWLAAWKLHNHALDRIAAALERIAPEPAPPVALKPEEQVTYVDEQADAQREEQEAVDALAKYMSEHPTGEEVEEVPEGWGEGDVRNPSD